MRHIVCQEKTLLISPKISHYDYCRFSNNTGNISFFLNAPWEKKTPTVEEPVHFPYSATCVSIMQLWDKQHNCRMYLALLELQPSRYLKK